MTFKIPDFLATNLPRHEPLDAMKRLMDPKDKFDSKDYALSAKLVEPPKRPDSLLEMYGGVRAVQQDAIQRPQHYTERQHEILLALTTGRTAVPEVTRAEKDELMLTFARSTEADAKRKEIIEKLTTPDDTLLDDGRTVDQAASDERASFQNQDFDEEIVIL